MRNGVRKMRIALKHSLASRRASNSATVSSSDFENKNKLRKPVSNENSVWDETGLDETGFEWNRFWMKPVLNDAGLETGSVTGYRFG